MAPETETPHETTPMNDPKRRFFSGDTLQQAVIQAANYFNLDPSYVAYQSLDKRHGFLKSRRKVTPGKYTLTVRLGKEATMTISLRLR